MTTVCVLFGGASSEHEVSLRSATMVLENIDRQEYEVIMVGITKDGRWLRYSGDVKHIQPGRWEAEGPTTPVLFSPDRTHRGLLELSGDSTKPVPVDVVFPVLHGKNGEDGTVQGLLTLAGIPVVGCGVTASALCMDKDLSHRVLLQAGIPKTRMVALTRQDTGDFDSLEKRLARELGYPMFVKPANAGSSVGVTKAKTSVELRDGISLAFSHDRKVVVEKTLTGQEVECSVMGNENPVASDVVGELVPSHEFYDYEGKYLDDSTTLHIPARLSDEAAQKVRETAVAAYKALDCSGYARVDFFVGEDGAVTLNEINTIPGFTSISMFPMLFEHSGVSNTALVSRLIEYALGTIQ